MNDARPAAATGRPTASQPSAAQPSSLSQYMEEFSALSEMSTVQQMAPPPPPKPQISPPQPLESTFPIGRFALSAAADVLSGRFES